MIFSKKFSINKLSTIGKVTIENLLKLKIEIPKVQRLCDHSRVNEIVKFQQKKHEKMSSYDFPGLLTIVKLNTVPGGFYMVDGMHRYEAIKQLAKKVILINRLELNIVM